MLAMIPNDLDVLLVFQDEDASLFSARCPNVWHFFERLSSIQFAQFVLMNSIHRGSPLHALATLFGLSDFDRYKYWRTRGCQSDSPEEQEVCTHSSFIELLGLSDARR